MSTKALKLIFLLTEALLMTSFVSGTELKYNRDAQCSGKVTVNINSFICDSDESQEYYNRADQYDQENMRYQSKRCQAGDDVTATGTVTFKRDMPQTVCIQRRTCFMGLACVSEEKEEGFDVCSELNLQPIERTYGNYEQEQYACPAKGTYTFSTDGEIPDTDGADLANGKSYLATDNGFAIDFVCIHESHIPHFSSMLRRVDQNVLHHHGLLRGYLL